VRDVCGGLKVITTIFCAEEKGDEMEHVGVGYVDSVIEVANDLQERVEEKREGRVRKPVVFKSAGLESGTCGTSTLHTVSAILSEEDIGDFSPPSQSSTSSSSSTIDRHTPARGYDSDGELVIEPQSYSSWCSQHMCNTNLGICAECVKSATAHDDGLRDEEGRCVASVFDTSRNLRHCDRHHKPAINGICIDCPVADFKKAAPETDMHAQLREIWSTKEDRTSLYQFKELCEKHPWMTPVVLILVFGFAIVAVRWYHAREETKERKTAKSKHRHWILYDKFGALADENTQQLYYRDEMGDLLRYVGRRARRHGTDFAMNAGSTDNVGNMNDADEPMRATGNHFNPHDNNAFRESLKVMYILPEKVAESFNARIKAGEKFEDLPLPGYVDLEAMNEVSVACKKVAEALFTKKKSVAIKEHLNLFKALHLSTTLDTPKQEAFFGPYKPKAIFDGCCHATNCPALLTGMVTSNFKKTCNVACGGHNCTHFIGCEPKAAIDFINRESVKSGCIHASNCPSLKAGLVVSNSKTQCNVACGGHNCVHFVGCVPSLESMPKCIVANCDGKCGKRHTNRSPAAQSGAAIKAAKRAQYYKAKVIAEAKALAAQQLIDYQQQVNESFLRAKVRGDDEKNETLINGPLFSPVAVAKCVGWATVDSGGEQHGMNCALVWNGVVVCEHLFTDFDKQEPNLTAKFYFGANIQFSWPQSKGKRIGHDLLWFPRTAALHGYGCLRADKPIIGKKVRLVTYLNLDKLLLGEYCVAEGHVQHIVPLDAERFADGSVINGVKAYVTYSSQGGCCSSPVVDETGRVVGFHNAGGKLNVFLPITNEMSSLVNNCEKGKDF